MFVPLSIGIIGAAPFAAKDKTMTNSEIMAKVISGEIDGAEAVKLIESNQHKSAPVGEIYLKVGAKGGACMYGINSRMPVTLYVEQWERLVEYVKSGKLDAFIADNADSLVRKSDSDTVKAAKAKTAPRLAATEKATAFAANTSVKAKV